MRRSATKILDRSFRVAILRGIAAAPMLARWEREEETTMGCFLAQSIFRFAFVTALAFATCGAAHATAWAGVRDAFWEATFLYYSEDGNVFSGMPDGVVMNCLFSGDPAENLRCGSHASLMVTSDGTAPAFDTYDATSGFEIVNTSDTEYTGQFTFRVEWSSFNPGGPQVGAYVDDPSREFAFYESYLTGLGAYDAHWCDTAGGGEYSAYRTVNACGVGSPDSSESEIWLGPLAAGGRAAATYEIFIRAGAEGAIGIPEPLTMALFGVGLAGVVFVRRRKARQGA